jgi:hypothetical protein
VCFLDADDEYAPGFFDTAVRLLDANPGVGGFRGGIELVGSHRPVHPVQLAAMVGSHPSTLVVRRAVADLVGGFPEHPAFRGPGAGEDVAFRQAVARHFRLAKTDHPFLRYRVGRGSHFDRFLDRSEVVDGRLVFTRPIPGGQPADLTAAWAAYDASVRERVTSALAPAAGEPLIGHACRAAAEFDLWAGRFPSAAGGLTPHEGFALFLWARDGPGRGAVVALAGPSEAAVGWLAAGTKAAARERVVALRTGTDTPPVGPAQDPDPEGSGLRDWVEWGAGPDAPPSAAVPDRMRLLWLGGRHRPGGARAGFDAWVGRLVPAGVVAVGGVGAEADATDFYQEIPVERVVGGWVGPGRCGSYSGPGLPTNAPAGRSPVSPVRTDGANPRRRVRPRGMTGTGPTPRQPG